MQAQSAQKNAREAFLMCFFVTGLGVLFKINCQSVTDRKNKSHTLDFPSQECNYSVFVGLRISGVQFLPLYKVPDV